MGLKKIFIILIVILFLFGIFLIFYKNRSKPVEFDHLDESKKEIPSTVQEKVENNKEVLKNEKTNSNKFSEEQILNKISRFDPVEKNSVKTTYVNQEDFVKYLLTQSSVKLSNSSIYHFADNIVAVPKVKLDPNKEYLWQDSKNVYYKSSKSFENYDQSKYVVLLDKKANRFVLSNGVYILKYKEPLKNKDEFENKHNIKVISHYSNDKILIVRANKNSNLRNIYKDLRSVESIESVELELISSYIEPN